MLFLAAQVCHLAKQNLAVAVAILPDPLLQLPNHHPTRSTAIRQGLLEDMVIPTSLQMVQCSVVTHTKRPFSITHYLLLLALIRQIL